MSTPIIPQESPSLQAADLICPVCGSLCRYNSGTAVVACLAGDWTARLTAEQNADLLDAICGISMMPVYPARAGP